MSFLVSVIIPCYNVEQYIEECVESVISQTYRNIEIICIDNNSDDDTMAKLISLKNKYQSITIESETTKGACAARNKGLALAKGEWIQFLDADDLLLATKIENQIKLLGSSNLNNIAFIAAASKKKLLNGDFVINKSIEENKYIAPFITKAGNTCANLWKKSFLIRVGAWNTLITSSQEAELMLKLIESGADYLVDLEVLTIIRVRESGQISQSNPVKRWKQFLDIRIDFLERLKSSKPNVYERFKIMYFDFLFVSITVLAQYDANEAETYYLKLFRNKAPIYSIKNPSKFFKIVFINAIGFKKFIRIINAFRS